MLGDGGKRLKCLEGLLRRGPAATFLLGLGQKVESLLQRDIDGRNLLGKRAEVVPPTDIRSIPSIRRQYRLLVGRMFSQSARQRKQLQGNFKSHIRRFHVRQQRSVFRFLFILGGPAHDIRTKPSLLEEDRLVRIGVDAERLGGFAGGGQHFEGLRHRQFIGRHVLHDARLAVPLFDERAELADADKDLLAMVPFLRLAE